MNVLYNLIIDNGGTIEIAHDQELEQLRSRALEACFEHADNLNTYISDALENVARYAEHVPDPTEVRGILADEQLGDWQAVLVTTAQLATQARLEQQVANDVERLRTALLEAEKHGYQARALHDLCKYGWEAHESEINWETGTQFRWRGLDGDVDADMLRVAISGDNEVWIDLVLAAA